MVVIFRAMGLGAVCRAFCLFDGGRRVLRRGMPTLGERRPTVPRLLHGLHGKYYCVLVLGLPGDIIPALLDAHARRALS
jgi:hypothetical protein